MNKRGFTLVELIVSFGLTMLVVFFLFQVIMSLKDIYIKSGIKSELLTKQSIISNKISDSFNKKQVKMILQCGKQCLNVYFSDDSSETLKINDKLVTYGNYTTELKNGSYFGNIDIKTETTPGVGLENRNSILKINIPIKHKLLKENYGVNIIYQYDSRKLSIGNFDFNQDKKTSSIYLKGNISTFKFVDETYVDPGYHLLNSDGTITENSPNVSIEGTVGNQLGDTYTLTYKLKDTSGNIIEERKRTILVIKEESTYAYNGNYQTFITPVTGTYKVELWGAQGGTHDLNHVGGKGGYTKGNISLIKGETLYVYVGGKGERAGAVSNNGGYNGGGFSGNNVNAKSTGGGGATDVRLVSGSWNNFDSLKSRIMVAAGGGGTLGSGNVNGGAAGGITGKNGTGINSFTDVNIYGGNGASQTKTGNSYENTRGGGFGYSIQALTVGYGGGGGSGYYGGSNGCGTTGGGGSSFISGYAGCNAIKKTSTSTNIIHTNIPFHYSGKLFKDSVMKSGDELLPNYTDGTMVGNSDNGYAKITILLETSKPEEIVYKETILNGADPILDEGMIPVKINNNGSVEKANLDEEWYNYNNKTWANAVLVTSDYRDTIMKASSGTKLDNTKILSYFVWVPRYKYELFNTGTTATTPTEIKITFENKTNTKSNGTTNGTYFTHPAFTFGDDELNGFWVAKFETTGTATNPTVLPNITSLRNQTISTQFNTVKKFTSATYGLISESRMMKDNEWGAAAYLSHSKYGINKEVRINNNSNMITGCGANAENGTATSTCEIVYGSSVASYPQSTTGNISGIFDMAGGSHEYVMANLNNTIGSSGFTTMPESKYYNNYTTTDKNTACSAGICKGVALSETVGWYGDYSNFLSATYPWLIRGGSYFDFSNSGLFSLYYDDGRVNNSRSFRTTIITN